MTRTRRRRWGLLAGAALMGAGAPAGIAAQDSGDPPTGDGPVTPSEPVRLELIDQQLAFEKDEPIRLTYRITGDLEAAAIVLPEPEPEPPRRRPTTEDSSDDEQTASAEKAPELVLQVTNYDSIDDIDRLDDLIGPDVDRLAFGFADDGVEIDEARDLIEIQDDGTGIMELEVPTDSGTSEPDHLLFDEPGVHALRVELLLGEFPTSTVLTTAGTVVQRLGPDSGSTPLHLAVMGAVPEPPVDADEAALQESARDVLKMVDVASAVENPATWSFPPRVVQALADDGRAPDLSLMLDGDELVSRPFVPLDVSSATRVDRVESFARQLSIGEEILTDAVPTAPTRRDVWIAQEPLSSAAAQALRDLGTRYVVMTPAQYTASVGEPPPMTDRFVEIELPQGGRLPLLVLDSLGLRLAEGSRPSLPPTEFAVRTAAQLLLESVLIVDRGRRSRVLAGERFGPLDGHLVADLERIAATTPDLRFTIGSALTGLTGVAVDEDGVVVVALPDVAGPDLTDRVDSLEQARVELFDAVAMLPDDDPRLSDWSARIESLLSTGYSDEEVVDIIDVLLAEATDVTTSVVAPEPFTFTLTGRTGEIELILGNTSPDPLTVVVDLSSTKLLFPEGETTVELLPDDETKVLVPVEARANGTSAVTVAVRSPTGTDLVEPVRLTSRVTTLTGLGQVLTGGLIVVLLTWWFTHWRSGRRAELAAGAQRHPSGTGAVASG